MKKFIWFLLFFLTIASGIFTWKYWDKVYPIVNLSITMDKAEAIEHASKFLESKNFIIKEYDVAVQFKEEGMLQAFVELEGGGKQAFLDMIRKDYYQPYQWAVRFYKYGKISEYVVQFTPDGKLNEFNVKVAEDEKGESLSKDKALEVALQGVHDFNIDMSHYELVEHNMIEQLSKRVDHVFVYERNDISLEKGKYRIILKVCGDIFSGLERIVKIPDEFTRRYQQMFADNKLLANIARNIAVFIYLFIFVLILSLFFFQNSKFLQLKKHAYLGIAFWAILFITMVNKWPILWNFYATEYSPLLFSFNQLANMVVVSLLFSLFVYCLLVLVDAADRYMFGWHIQFLKSWSTGALASVQVFEMTLLGYLGAIILIGYQVLYNLWTLKMGWWSPLNTVVDPNILSNYIPFLSPIGSAFQAGFWEEVAFRGLPLAGIGFLTRNSKNKRWWFLLMMIIQALIFGALHANYPQQPFYNRLVELFVPSTILFGIMYYAFGLLPGIIMHFVYDAFLMCIPIWVSDFLLQKIFAAMCIAIPFLMVVFAWYRNKMKLIQAAADLYNHADRYEHPEHKEEVVQRPVGCKLGRKYVVLLTSISFVFVVFSYLYVPINFANSRSTISPDQALAIAKNTIEQYGCIPNDMFSENINFLSNNQSIENKFIWQTYGSVSYQNLEQDYIPAHGWQIMWKKFKGSVEERAEMFGLMIGMHGDILKIYHTIPESFSGADLDDASAQKLSLDFIKKVYGLEKKSLELVSCESKKHENRRDFVVVYKDLHRFEFKKDLGQARISVSLSGDQLKEIKRMIHVPEQWSRQENSRALQEAILNTILYVITLMVIILAVYFCIRQFKFSIKFLIQIISFVGCYVLFRSLNFFNAWNQVVMMLSTAEPWINQIISIVSSYFLYYIIIGLLLVTLLSLFIKHGARSACKAYWPWLVGLILVGAAKQCLKLWFMGNSVHMIPIDYECDYINFQSPVYGMIIAYFLYKLLLSSVELMSFSIIAQKLSHRYQILFFIVVGIITSDIASLSNISVWIISGLCMGLLLYLLNRFIISQDFEAEFLIVFGASLMKLLPTVWYMAYPGVLEQVVSSGIIFGIFVVYLYKKL